MNKIQPVTFGPKHHFFGFHDLCPWDISGRYMLAMETDFIDRPPKAGDKAKICLIDLENNNKLEVLAETDAWNFHQGCRAQWLPNDPEKIIYNDRRSNKFISVVFDVKNRKEINVLKCPIYAISPKGDFGLGLNFARLKRYGGYGYAGEVEEPESDGIFMVDFVSGTTNLIIPVENGHILTHIAFNPGGSRICFIDKYRLPDGGFLQRLITANPDGADLYVLPSHASHFDWKSDTEILVYGKFSPKITAFRKMGAFRIPILKPILYFVRKMRGLIKQKIAGQSYFLLKDKTQNVERVAVGLMTEDGHPQFSSDGKWVITDTYPDKNHERTLILYDWENKKRINLGEFYSLPHRKSLANYHSDESWDISEMRSDLHPRWNRSGTQACIDSVHEGTRQIYIAQIDNSFAA